ncbi:CDP-alcohol phosphatidyltransferase family protein [Hydrogenimonas cancrithermarum]|uniref:CDP-diacylglycerol--serine O-phosphatidyltransferase n=1 Tax=Hydrogenimonas cancrithermarum TaxID=2993563 RepID=A0ABM8FIN7_9BACT|nr:CDP-alcohol phosphatidyltransferase family protein [Hydrogenimonas cancrithermarum]BDY12146.1 CDP-diacylglycerol--serine O-phosphatidyltransferase [Hydrogenimonas cancrithermarum]
MNPLLNPKSHFNLANLFTMVNITCGLVATYFITQNNFFYAIVFAWIGGAFDIFDGKIARKFNLSNEFGIQLDSFADFLSFVLVPVFLIFQAVYTHLDGFWFNIGVVATVYYVISGLRRLIQFNIDAEAGEVGKFFVGVPTPLGAILLWLVYLGYTYGVLPGQMVILFMVVIGWLLNSTLRVPHP